MHTRLEAGPDADVRHNLMGTAMLLQQVGAANRVQNPNLLHVIDKVDAPGARDSSKSIASRSSSATVNFMAMPSRDEIAPLAWGGEIQRV